MKPNTKMVTLDDKEQEYDRVAFFDQENVPTFIETVVSTIFSINVDGSSLELYKEDIPLIIKALQEFQKL